ncbi:MAG: hypothetical protein ABIV26_06885, partial [Candidatus Limnocylindrales bacterium]
MTGPLDPSSPRHRQEPTDPAYPSRGRQDGVVSPVRPVLGRRSRRPWAPLVAVAAIGIAVI